jgi:hypothetical protein
LYDFGFSEDDETAVTDMVKPKKVRGGQFKEYWNERHRAQRSGWLLSDSEYRYRSAALA